MGYLYFFLAYTNYILNSDKQLLWNNKTTLSCETKNRVSLWIYLYEFNCKLKIHYNSKHQYIQPRQTLISIKHRNTNLRMRWCYFEKETRLHINARGNQEWWAQTYMPQWIKRIWTKQRKTSQKTIKMSNANTTKSHGIGEGQAVPVFIGHLRCDSQVRKKYCRRILS